MLPTARRSQGERLSHMWKNIAEPKGKVFRARPSVKYTHIYISPDGRNLVGLLVHTNAFDRLKDLSPEYTE